MLTKFKKLAAKNVFRVVDNITSFSLILFQEENDDVTKKKDKHTDTIIPLLRFPASFRCVRIIFW